ncbi:MAG: hypothetical protein PHV02_04625, partial [Rhodocyclaceae bacterium]|nr:hypothetical protein [Rhodocyclaceae bacterium]
MIPFKKLALFSVLGLSSVVALAFSSTMSATEVEAEVKVLAESGRPLEAILASAKAAGVEPATLTIALLGQGMSVASVVSGMVSAGFDSAVVVRSAIAGAGADAA